MIQPLPRDRQIAPAPRQVETAAGSATAATPRPSAADPRPRQHLFLSTESLDSAALPAFWDPRTSRARTLRELRRFDSVQCRHMRAESAQTPPPAFPQEIFAAAAALPRIDWRRWRAALRPANRSADSLPFALWSAVRLWPAKRELAAGFLDSTDAQRLAHRRTTPTPHALQRLQASGREGASWF